LFAADNRLAAAVLSENQKQITEFGLGVYKVSNGSISGRRVYMANRRSAQEWEQDMGDTLRLPAGAEEWSLDSTQAVASADPSGAPPIDCRLAANGLLKGAEEAMKTSLGTDYAAYLPRIVDDITASCIETKWSEELKGCVTTLTGSDQQKCAPKMSRSQKQDMAVRSEKFMKEHQAAEAAKSTP
jgi:hypothetical protein